MTTQEATGWASPSPRWAAAARVAALIQVNFGIITREPGAVVSRLVQPIVLITLMRPLYVAALAKDGPQAGTSQVVTGMLVMFSLLALSLSAGAILLVRILRTWDRLRATPARPIEMLIGKAVPAFALLALQQAVVIGFGVVAFGLHVGNPGLLVAAIACWALTLLGIGAALGACLRSFSELNAAYDVGGLLLSALGGALVPLAQLPHWAQAIAPASPGYWAMSALQSAILGHPQGMFRAAGVLLAIGAATGALAAWRIGRGWPRSRLM
jgi:ABC-2 type transport system permease protein